MSKYILFVLASMSINIAVAQKPLVWQILGMTTYRNDFQEGEVPAYNPIFPAILESQYEGEEVFISGYIIPIDIESNKYALSKNAFSSCFFCGNAGPETVIELKFLKSPGRFATDEYLMIKGILVLNRNNNGLFFTLKNAEIHG
jgi:hypothetical protein